MTIALTRSVSPSINRCELGYLPRTGIDCAIADAQHRAYGECLATLGLAVTPLPPAPELPDAVFVEDAAVVVDEVAVIPRMGAPSRRPEVESVAPALARYRPLVRMDAPATLDGGDVMHVGKTLFVGASARTNAEGIRQLRDLLKPFGYAVQGVAMRDCLHLKSACCRVGEDSIIANRRWVDVSCFGGYRILDVPPEEPWAANVLALGETLVMPSAFPATHGMLEALGMRVKAVDVSELMKAEAGVTCMSVIFRS